MLLVKVQPEKLSERLSSYPSGGEGDRPVEASGTQVRLGRAASARAVTRVKSEQAPKCPRYSMGAPSLLIEDEGRRDRGCNRPCLRLALRGIGHSTRAHISRQHGRPALVPEGNGDFGLRRGQESEERIVLLKPGNSGGGKALWFEVRLDRTRGDEGQGIGVSLETPAMIQSLQGSLYGEAKQGPEHCECLAVKLVREPDDLNGQVRFDERAEETERWTNRRDRQRKTHVAIGAAGPARHRASARLYTCRPSQWSGSASGSRRERGAGDPRWPGRRLLR